MYHCDRCNKSFEKRKAYIGHCSSHNRGESYKIKRRKNQKIKNENLHECKFCNKKYESGVKLGGHVIRCRSNPNRVVLHYKHTKSSKNKISIAISKYLKSNPDKHSWKKSSKFKSAPCEKFKEILRQNDIKFEEEFNPLEDRLFSIDIAFPNIKLGIEINGNQHYTKSGKLRSYYQKRHNLIVKAGWTLIEIPYKNLKLFESDRGG